MKEKNRTKIGGILWQKVRAKRLEGIKFRRQVPIGNYIVDFLAFSKKLIIELDGSTTKEEEHLYAKYLTLSPHDDISNYKLVKDPGAK